MIALWGHIDESGNSDDLFSLACLISDGNRWFEIENEWKAHIDRKRAQLAAAGRRVFKRYHAADCANLKGEFHKKYGWTREEEIEFSAPLHDLFRKYDTQGYALTVNLRELEDDIPEVLPNPEGFAHVILLQLLMMRICEGTLRLHPDAIISLIHDRSKYAAAMQEAFHQMLVDPNFKCRERFNTIAQMGWEQCIALQPTDLFAYEAFKEFERQSRRPADKPRYSLLRSFGEGSKFGGNAGGLEKLALAELRDSFYQVDDAVRSILLATARVSTKARKSKDKPSAATEG